MQLPTHTCNLGPRAYLKHVSLPISKCLQPRQLNSCAACIIQGIQRHHHGAAAAAAHAGPSRQVQERPQCSLDGDIVSNTRRASKKHGMSGAPAPHMEPMGRADLEAYLSAHPSLAEVRLVEDAEKRLEEMGAVKSLVLVVADRPWVVVLQGSDRLDMKKVAAVFNVSRRGVRLALRDETLHMSGFAPGTVPPLGHRTPLPTCVDVRVTHLLGPVYGGGGEEHVHMVVPVPTLVAHTRAQVHDVAVGDPLAVPAVPASQPQSAGPATPASQQNGHAAAAGSNGASGGQARGLEHATSPTGPQPGGQTAALEPQGSLSAGLGTVQPWATAAAATATGSNRTEHPLPWGPGSSMVQMVAIVASRRRVAKLLQFCTLIPETAPVLPPSGKAVHLRRLWANPNNLNSANSLDMPEGGSSVHADPCEVQLIMGKTLETKLGRQAAADLMDSVRPGAVIQFTGKVQPHGPPQPTTTQHPTTSQQDSVVSIPMQPTGVVLDVVCHQLEVLYPDREALEYDLSQAQQAGQNVHRASDILRLRQLSSNPTPSTPRPGLTLHPPARPSLAGTGMQNCLTTADQVRMLTGDQTEAFQPSNSAAQQHRPGKPRPGGNAARGTQVAAAKPPKTGPRRALQGPGEANVQQLEQQQLQKQLLQQLQQQRRQQRAVQPGQAPGLSGSAQTQTQGGLEGGSKDRSKYWEGSVGQRVELVEDVKALRRIRQHIAELVSWHQHHVQHAGNRNATPDADGNPDPVPGAPLLATDPAAVAVASSATATPCAATPATPATPAATAAVTATLASATDAPAMDSHTPAAPASDTQGPLGLLDLLPPPVSLDCEWQPFRKDQKPTPVALLQVATRGHAFLIDMLATAGRVQPIKQRSSHAAQGYRSPLSEPLSEEERAELQEELGGLLADIFVRPGVTPLGFGLGHDLTRLTSSYPWLLPYLLPSPTSHTSSAQTPPHTTTSRPPSNHQPASSIVLAAVHNTPRAANPRLTLASPEALEAAQGHVAASVMHTSIQGVSYVDVLSLARSTRPETFLMKLGAPLALGLSRTVRQVFGTPLDKTCQASSWGHRPLTRAQTAYAAADVLCLIALHDELLCPRSTGKAQ